MKKGIAFIGGFVVAGLFSILIAVLLVLGHKQQTTVNVMVTDKYESNWVDFEEINGQLYPKFHTSCHIVTEVAGFVVSSQTYESIDVGDRVYVERIDYEDDNGIGTAYKWLDNRNASDELGGTIEEFKRCINSIK